MMTTEQHTIVKFEKAICSELQTLHRMAVWYTGSPVEAQDLVQDTLLLALRFQDGYKQGSNLRAWLLKVMRNRHISVTRRRKPGKHLSTTRQLLSRPG